MKSMWVLRRGPSRPAYSNQIKSIFIYRDFQVRYIRFLFGAIIVVLVAVNAPIYYFIHQNYQIFIGLAYQNSPDLISQLEREQAWINGFLLAAFTGVVLFCFLYGVRLTHRIALPLARLQQHMKQLTRGHWYIPEVDVDESSEFYQLVDTYNYFYKSLRTNNERQLDMIARIHVDEKDRDSQAIVRELLKINSQQLGELNADGEAELPSPDRLHAS